MTIMKAMRRAACGLATAGVILCGGAAARAADALNDRVEAYSSNFYTVEYAAGELVTLSLSGDGDTDLDVFVRSPYGEVIAAGRGPVDEELVRFQAPCAGCYEVEVANLGGVWNGFFLRSK